MVVNLEDHAGPCCPNVLHRTRAEVSERLDIVPAQFRVLFVHRPKYACQACEEVVMQAPAPARLGGSSGLPTDATVAQALSLQVRLSSATLPQTQIYILGRALTAVTLRTHPGDWTVCYLRQSEAEFWAELPWCGSSDFGLFAKRRRLFSKFFDDVEDEPMLSVSKFGRLACYPFAHCVQFGLQGSTHFLDGLKKIRRIDHQSFRHHDEHRTAYSVSALFVFLHLLPCNSNLRRDVRKRLAYERTA